MTNSRENLSVRCEKNGYESAVVSVPSTHKDSATWGNVVLGGGIGYIWDRKTGAAFIYPSTINLTLVKSETTQTNTENNTKVNLSGETTAEQLKQLSLLYKDGVLTKKEFTELQKLITDSDKHIS